MHLGRCPAIQRAVRTFLVVEAEVVRQPPLEGRNRVVVTQVDILVLDTAPEPLDEDIIQSPIPTVHADQDLTRLQPAGELMAGKLAALIRVENTRLGLSQGLVDHFDAEYRVQSIRQAPSCKPPNPVQVGCLLGHMVNKPG